MLLRATNGGLVPFPGKDEVMVALPSSLPLCSLAAPPTAALIQRERGTRKSAENLRFGSGPSGPLGPREAMGDGGWVAKRLRVELCSVSMETTVSPPKAETGW